MLNDRVEAVKVDWRAQTRGDEMETSTTRSKSGSRYFLVTDRGADALLAAKVSGAAWRVALEIIRKEEMFSEQVSTACLALKNIPRTTRKRAVDQLLGALPDLFLAEYNTGRPTRIRLTEQGRKVFLRQ